MMRERLLALAQQRMRLVARMHDERAAINASLAPADAAASTVASLVSTASSALREARNYPLLAIGAGALLVAIRPRRVVALIAKGWSLWGMYRGAQGWLHRFADTPPHGSRR